MALPNFEGVSFSENPWRTDFPALSQSMNGKNLVFLDTAASAQKPRAVIEAMTRIYETGYANIHRGAYRISQDLTGQFEAVRAKIARFIGAEHEKTIIFTRNATESINLVAQSWGRTFLKSGDEVILTAMEHHANIVPWQILQSQIGIVIKVIPVRDDGTLDLDTYRVLLSPRTRLVGAVHISNALGTINPVKDIVALAKGYNPEIMVLIDGSQGLVHRPIPMFELGADFYVFTGHKLYGPTGIGVMYGKPDVLESMPPYQGGGDMIETVHFEGTTFKPPPYRFEAGTPAIVEVIGLGAAIDYLEQCGLEDVQAHENALLRYGAEALSHVHGLKMLGEAPYGDKVGIFSFTMARLHPSDVGMILDQCGVAVRTGHHCCMPLMARFGVTGTIRASLGLYSTKGDIDALVQGLEKARDLLL